MVGGGGAAGSLAQPAEVVPGLAFAHGTSPSRARWTDRPTVDEATMPARAPSAAAWVMVVCAARIRPYEMMPYSSAMRRTTTNANSTISAPRSSRRRHGLLRHPTASCDPKANPLLCILGGSYQFLNQFRVHRRCDPCDVILGCHLSSVHRTYGPFGVSPGTLHRRMVKRTYVPSDCRVVPSNGATAGAARKRVIRVVRRLRGGNVL